MIEFEKSEAHFRVSIYFVSIAPPASPSPLSPILREIRVIHELRKQKWWKRWLLTRDNPKTYINLPNDQVYAAINGETS